MWNNGKKTNANGKRGIGLTCVEFAKPSLGRFFQRQFCECFLHMFYHPLCIHILHKSTILSITNTSTISWLFLSSLTLTLPGPSAGVSGSLDSYCSLKPLCSGMGEVVPARTSPTLLPPSPRTVLSLSCFKVSQFINCRDWHFKS